MYETNYRGIRYCFKEDCLILNDKVIDYRQISNIRHRGGQDPAFIFEYSGRQFAMPYPPEELGAILPYMKKASMMEPEAEAEPEAKAEPAAGPEPAAETAPREAGPEPAAEPAAETESESVAEPEPMAVPAAEPEPEPAEGPEEEAPKKSRKKLFIIIGAVVLAVLIALFLFIGGGKDGDSGEAADSGSAVTEEADQDIPDYESSDADPGASYESVYEEYTARMKEEAPKLAEEYTKEAASLSTVEEKAELSNDKISLLAETSNEGVEKMAEIMYASGDAYDVYEEWSMKLMNVYQEQAQLITDAYTQSAN